MNHTNGIRAALACSAAILAMASSAAYAQAQSQGQSIEEVTVTATRLTQAGFNAPTPTTVVGSDLIQSLNEDNLFNVLTEMPSLIGSNTGVTGEHGSSGGTNGVDSPNLFALGTQRTLTLLDGQRVVSALDDGTPDIQEFPHLLIDRVDVVTGGASASWGSDAIAGVVNFVTNKTFEGLKAELSGGISTYGDNATGHAAFAAGTAFLGGRGHFEMSAEYDHTDGLPGGQYFGCGPNNCTLEGGRKWYRGQKSADYGAPNLTPPGQPQVNNLFFVQDNQMSEYGLINSGPLQGTAFGTNGQPYQYNYGVGPNGLQGVPAHNGSAKSPGSVINCISSFCQGGELAQDVGGGDGLAQARTRGDFYDRVSYDLNEQTNIWLTTNFSEVGTDAVAFPSMGFNNLKGVPANTVGQVAQLPGIQCGTGPSAANLPAGDLSGPNAYLPASINAACIANNINSFGLGSTETGQLPPEYVRTNRFSWRVAVGGDGAFNALGSDWTWSSYYTHGQTRSSDNVGPMLLYPYFYAAVDSVVAQAGDGSGAVPGTIVCRNATARAEGCVPFDPFGAVQPTQSQLNWIQGGKWRPGPYQIQNVRQDAASFSVNGAPFSDWAGKVAVAAGIEYRQEGMAVLAGGAETGNQPGTNGALAGVCSDALLNCAQGNNWYAANFHQTQGTFHVSEGFVEFGVPLLDSVSFGRADLDLAARYEMYAPEGDFLTWKAGLNWDTPVPGLRFRTLMSRDVHAPSLNDLYAGANVAASSANDPWIGQQISTFSATAGNPLLKPERSINSQLGLVYQPDWLPGFHMSADYYRYNVSAAISAVDDVTAINDCYAGLTQFCSAIHVNGPGTPATNSNWSYVDISSFNVASLVTDGVNYEADYAFDLQDWGVPGSWTLRAIATNVSKYITNPGIAGEFTIDTAGYNDGDVPGAPHWQGTFFQTYSFDSIGDSTIGHTQITLTERLISSGKHMSPADLTEIQCAPGSCPASTLQFPTVNDVHVPGIIYFNLGINHDLSDVLQAYFQIDNLLNKDPPPYFYNSYIPRPTNEQLYDPIGRMFNVGVRFRM